MLYFSRWKTIATLAVCLLGVLLTIPNMLSQVRYDALPAFAKHRFGLGLDLRGGAHLLTKIDLDELRKDWVISIQDDVRKRLREAKLVFNPPVIQGGAVSVRLNNPTDLDVALSTLKKMIQTVGNPIAGTSVQDLDVKAASADIITVTPTEPALNERATQAIGAAIEVIRKRLDPDGTKEVAVQRQGGNRILIQIPGVETEKELQAIRDDLSRAAKMTFHLVHPTITAEEAKQTRVPSGYMIVPSTDKNPPEELIETRPILSGADLDSADPGFDSRTNEPIISFRFKTNGARIFGRVTQENVGRRFAIVLDGKAISAPVIRDQILGGTGQISGNFTVEEVNRTATLLKSGSLPAKLTIEEERVVGASLGQDSIEQGKRAGLIGLLGVAAFMIGAYGLFGVFAVIGAALHVVLVLALMSLLGATMTLPGIAGVVLTIGMAVDANVLIYERIREELRNGKTPLAAIDAGFTRAYATIIDSQLTTFIAGLLMFALGSGPIKGFAVTLTLGILTTVFTAFTVSRMLASWWVASQDRRAVPAPL
jgi:protein-export membrane protein SecD